MSDDSGDIGRRGFFEQFLREIVRPVAEFRDALRGESAPEAAPVEGARAPGDRWLRPPSVRGEWAFLATCERSGECVQACPANAIRPFPADAGRLARTPYIVAAEQPCVICTSLACMAACPSGALTPQPMTALGMGVARVRWDVCLRSEGHDCQLCAGSCPLHDLGMRVVDIALDGTVHVDEALCVGCGCCERACPTEPRAIAVVATRLLAQEERA
jgi:ferredoxin-type protein NapG